VSVGRGMYLWQKGSLGRCELVAIQTVVPRPALKPQSSILAVNSEYRLVDTRLIRLSMHEALASLPPYVLSRLIAVYPGDPVEYKLMLHIEFATVRHAFRAE
jgi:hypothetical protein